MRENLGLALGVVGFLLAFISAACRWHARRSRTSTHFADAIGGAALLSVISAFILLPPE